MIEDLATAWEQVKMRSKHSFPTQQNKAVIQNAADFFTNTQSDVNRFFVSKHNVQVKMNIEQCSRNIQHHSGLLEVHVVFTVDKEGIILSRECFCYSGCC